MHLQLFENITVGVDCCYFE